MTVHADVLDHWPEFRLYLPAGFDLEGTARARGAFTRAREAKSPEALLRQVLAYGGCAGLASLPDPYAGTACQGGTVAG
jgi:hypothetical protein